jgi:hypothetical protein
MFNIMFGPEPHSVTATAVVVITWSLSCLSTKDHTQNLENRINVANYYALGTVEKDTVLITGNRRILFVPRGLFLTFQNGYSGLLERLQWFVRTVTVVF